MALAPSKAFSFLRETIRKKMLGNGNKWDGPQMPERAKKPEGNPARA